MLHLNVNHGVVFVSFAVEIDPSENANEVEIVDSNANKIVSSAIVNSEMSMLVRLHRLKPGN